MVLALISDYLKERPPKLDILDGLLREVSLYLLANGALIFRKCFNMQIQIKQAANSETLNLHIANGANNVLAIWHSALSIY